MIRARACVWMLLAVAATAHLQQAAADEGAGDAVRTAPTRHEGTGIWKAAVPPSHMKGEFGGHDPVGLAAGAKIKADCSINWIDPDSGKLYCFSSATSQSYFQDWPAANIERASKSWQQLSQPGS
jgi:hypothetical protein